MDTDNKVSLIGYVLVLVSWWRDIVVFSIAGALLGVLAVLALDVLLPRYEAYADVAIIQSGVNVAIDERFGVVTQQDRRLVQRQASGRRAALLGLVHKASLAQTISAMLPPEEEYSPTSLLLKVSAELVTFGVASAQPQSDLIRITARMESPERAKYVADAWAETYVRDINQLYESVPQQVIATILQERDNVRRQYQDAEAALQDFLAASKVDYLTMRVNALSELNSELMEVWKQGTSLRYVARGNSDADQLRNNYARQRELVTAMRMASSLRDQVAATASGSASLELALSLLMARLYGGDTPTEISFDAISSGGNAATNVASVNALIETLQDRLTNVENENEVLAQSIDTFLGLADSGNTSLTQLTENLDKPVEEQPLLALMNKIEQDKQALVAQKQLETAALADLTLERDLRRSTLETLQNEVVELQLRATASPTAVRLASYSVIPSLSAWPSPLLGGLAAILVASFGGVCMAYTANAMGRRPFLRRAAAQREPA